MENDNIYSVFYAHPKHNKNKIWPKLWKSYTRLRGLARKWKASFFSVGGTQKHGRAETQFVSCCLQARQKEDKSSVNLDWLYLPHWQYRFILHNAKENIANSITMARSSYRFCYTRAFLTVNSLALLLEHVLPLASWIAAMRRDREFGIRVMLIKLGSKAAPG